MDDPTVELERLRVLIGPSETAYEQLRVDRDEAQRVARDALAETGELRGRLLEAATQLARARQDQELLLRRERMTPFNRARDSAGRWWTRRVTPSLRRIPRIPGALIRRIRARAS